LFLGIQFIPKNVCTSTWWWVHPWPSHEPHQKGTVSSCGFDVRIHIKRGSHCGYA